MTGTILFVCVLSLLYCNAIIAQSTQGFESGFQSWESEQIGTGVNQIVSTTKFVGLKSLRQYANYPNASMSGVAYLRLPAPAGLTIYNITGWARVSQRSARLAGSFFGFSFGEGASRFEVGWNPNDNAFSYFYSKNARTVEYSANVGLPINTWKKFTVIYNASDATASLWVAGVLIHNRIDTFTYPGHTPKYFLMYAGGLNHPGNLIEQFVDGVTVTPVCPVGSCISSWTRTCTPCGEADNTAPVQNFEEGFGTWFSTGQCISEIVPVPLRSASNSLRQYAYYSPQDTTACHSALKMRAPAGAEVYTMSLWINVTKRTDWTASSVIGFQFSDHDMGWNPSTGSWSYFYTPNYQTVPYQSNVGLPVGQVRSIKVMYNASEATATLWVNGVLVHNRIATFTPIGQSPQYFVIIAGGLNHAGNYIEQYVDDVVVSPVCSTGSYLTNATASCNFCPIGTYNNEKGAMCVGCPRGTSSNQPGSTACTTCPAGKYSPGGSFPCAACPKGQFSSAPGAARCDPCPFGTYQSTAGARSCIPSCPTGTAPSLCSAAPACSTCAAGTFASENRCNKCLPGMYNPSPKQTHCMTCAAGTYSNEGAISCTPCPPNTTNMAGFGNGVASCVPI